MKLTYLQLKTQYKLFKELDMSHFLPCSKNNVVSVLNIFLAVTILRVTPVNECIIFFSRSGIQFIDITW